MSSSSTPLLICETCAGRGTVGLHRCKNCRGYGAGLLCDKFFLYWGGPKVAEDVILKKIQRAINKVIDLILILFCSFGLASLIYHLYRTDFINLFRKNFWLAPNKFLFVFFFGGFSLLYFAYRAARLSYEGEKPRLCSFSVGGWAEAKKIKSIDLARAISFGAQSIIGRAYLLAKKYKTNVGLEILFLSLLSHQKIKIIFGRLGIPLKILNEKVGRRLTRGAQKQIFLDRAALEIFFNSYLEAGRRAAKRLEVNILLLETVRASEFLREVLYDLNIDLEKLENVVKWIEIQDKLRERWLEFRRASLLRPRGEVNRAMTALATPTLDRYSEDLTFYAKRGMIDLCLGREEIFQKMFRVIEGGGRGAVLVGERGVGKSAIVDGLAELMIKEEVPESLKDKRLIRFSLSEILGGTTSEEAGKRIIAVAADAWRAGNIVLEIPNLEYFDSSEKLPLAALLAEELSKSRLPVFASTTAQGYARVVEGTALVGIFERIDVPEPDKNLAIQILEAESASIEYKEEVYFSYEALAGAVRDSDRYLRERFLPDKAIEIIKETANYVRRRRGKNSLITYEDTAKIISEKSGVPLTAVTESEKARLLRLEELIKERIVGQKEAVEAVSRSLRRVRAGMTEGKRPIASFLFLGPTGVGKTELAKTIAEIYFGGEKEMIRMDMSEYQEKQSIARLIGEGNLRGVLTEAVRHKPFALLLLDEIEKAHPDILNLFLQVMDDGRLTDAGGRTMDFTNIILVATSNAASDFIARELHAGTKMPDIRARLLEEKLGAYFRPEFLNRFDGVIVFAPLTPEEILKITGLLLKKVAKNLESKGVELIVEETAKKELAEAGYDPKFGARPLRRAIAREIEDRLANLLLESKVKRRDKVVFHSLGKVEVVEGRKI